MKTGASLPKSRARFFAYCCLGGLCLSLAWCTTAAAEESNIDEIAQALRESASDLSESRPREAIRRLEALADQGLHHPDLSFNRGLAYAARASTATGEVGDLGHAAAAFAETLQQRPSDAQAEAGLRQVQIRVARRKASDKSSAENDSLGMIEKTFYALSPLWLFWLALTGSAGASVGLILRFSGRETWRLTGLITLGIGAFVLVSASSLFFFRQSLFVDARVGVVIAPEAGLVDEGGSRLKGELPLRESTVVHLGPERHGLAPLVGLGQKRWIRLGQVRLLNPN